MRQTVRDAFLSVRGEHSPDVVIADPDLNQEFLGECQAGLSDPPVLNQCLLNLRKSSQLQGIKSKRMVLRNQEDYRFASEIAVRFLERRDQVSLDQVLCDPVRAAELALSPLGSHRVSPFFNIGGQRLIFARRGSSVPSF